MYSELKTNEGRCEGQQRFGSKNSVRDPFQRLFITLRIGFLFFVSSAQNISFNALHQLLYIILINSREVEARFCIAPYDACVQMLAKLRNVRFNLAKMVEILATDVSLCQASGIQLLSRSRVQFDDP